MASLHICLSSALCLWGAVAYQVEHTFGSVGSEAQQQAPVAAPLANPAAVVQHSSFPQHASPTQHAVVAAANGQVGAPQHPNPQALVKTAPQGPHDGKQQQKVAHPTSPSYAHHTPTPPVAHSQSKKAAPDVKIAAKTVREEKAARKSLDAVVHKLEREASVVKQAKKEYTQAQREERASKASRDEALKQVRIVKEKRAQDIEKSKSLVAKTSNGTGNTPDMHKADAAVRKAERNFKTATRQWQHAREETVKRGQAIKTVSHSAQQLEHAKEEADRDMHVASSKVQEEKKVKQDAIKSFEKLKEEQTKLKPQKKALVGEYKEARRVRLQRKGVSPKDQKAMKVKEDKLRVAAQALTDKLKASRKELVSHKGPSNQKASPKKQGKAPQPVAKALSSGKAQHGLKTGK